MLSKISNHAKRLRGIKAFSTERQALLLRWLLLGGTLVGFLLLLFQSSGVLSFLTAQQRAQSGRVPAFVEELRRLSGRPTSFMDSADLATAIAQRMETINITGERILENDIVEALARADWYFFSREDVDNLYQGRRLEISEGRMLSAVKRFLQQRGRRLPVTIWSARRPDGSVMIGRIPPPHWGQNPPSDLTLRGYISLIRERIAEQVPGIMNPSGPGPIMRPLEAALVAYVLMTADNGWIYPQRARLYVTADEIRSFLGDLGIKFRRGNRYFPPNGQPLPR